MTAADPHADKFNDPRASVTGRGIAIGIGITVVATFAALVSIYARRTHLDKTTDFYGPVVIEALQLAEQIDLIPQVPNTQASGFPAVISLTATPGLGHLRRAILDDRHYDWTRIETSGALSKCDGLTFGEKSIPGCMRLRLSDPTLERFEPIELDIDLIEGKIGVSDQNRCVHVTEYVKPKLQSYFTTTISVSRLTYDNRE